MISLKVIPLDRLRTFLILILNFKKISKFFAASYKNAFYLLNVWQKSCIEYFLPIAGALLFDEKIRKALRKRAACAPKSCPAMN
jgi:hypothetical protein